MNEQQCLQFRGLPTVLIIWLNSQKCVSAHNTARSWYDALQNCGERGGQLLNIWNQNEQTELANVLRSNFQQNRLWIGLTRWHWQWLGCKLSYFSYWNDSDKLDTIVASKLLNLTVVLKLLLQSCTKPSIYLDRGPTLERLCMFNNKCYLFVLYRQIFSHTHRYVKDRAGVCNTEFYSIITFFRGRNILAGSVFQQLGQWPARGYRTR